MYTCKLNDTVPGPSTFFTQTLTAENALSRAGPPWLLYESARIAIASARHGCQVIYNNREREKQVSGWRKTQQQQTLRVRNDQNVPKTKENQR